MPDLKLSEKDGVFDLSIKNGNLETIQGFDSLLKVALFTDSRANDTQVVAVQRRRGWLGNLAIKKAGRQRGSLLWLLDQTKNNQETLNRAVDFAQKALEFIVEDKLVNSVKAQGKIIPLKGIELTIIIETPDKIITKNFKLWEATGI